MASEDIKMMMEAFARAQADSTARIMESVTKMNAETSQRQQDQFQQFATGMAAMMQQTSSRGGDQQVLVDAKGVGKPDRLTVTVASDAIGFKTWRYKFANWIGAACSGAGPVLEAIENDNGSEIDLARFEQLNLDFQGDLARLSAQLKATLVSLCEAEPLVIVMNAPKGERGGLECYRRLCNRYDPTGPRSAKVILQRILSSKAVPAYELKTGIEKLEAQFEEYKIRASRELTEDLRMLVIEQILPEPIKTHIALNADRLSEYGLMRDEIVKYSERMAQDRLLGSGAAPMDIGEVGQASANKGPGKGKFEGECRSCGKWGHMARDCWQAGSKGKGKGKSKAQKGKGKGKDGKGKKGQSKGYVKSVEEEGGDAQEAQEAHNEEDQEYEVEYEMGAMFALERVLLKDAPWRKPGSGSAEVRVDRGRPELDESVRGRASDRFGHVRPHASWEKVDAREAPKAKPKSAIKKAPLQTMPVQLNIASGRVDSADEGQMLGPDRKQRVMSDTSRVERSKTCEQSRCVDKEPAKEGTRVWKPRWKIEKEQEGSDQKLEEPTTVPRPSCRPDKDAAGLQGSAKMCLMRELAKVWRNNERVDSKTVERLDELDDKGRAGEQRRDNANHYREKFRREGEELRAEMKQRSTEPKLPVRVRMDMECGRSFRAAWKKEKSRRRASQHRKEGAIERSLIHKDLELKWAERHDDPSSASSMQRPGERGLSGKELMDFRVEEEEEPPVIKERVWKPEKKSENKRRKAVVAFRQRRAVKRLVEREVEKAENRRLCTSAKKMPRPTRAKKRRVENDILEVEGGWKEPEERLDVVIDSGACECALPQEWYTQCPLKPKAGRIRYRAANGATMQASGTRMLDVQLEDGSGTKMNFTVLPVKRALASVSKMVEKGCRLVFDDAANGGSYVEVKSTGKKHPLSLQNGVYVLPTWVRMNGASEQDFPRQAQP